MVKQAAQPTSEKKRKAWNDEIQSLTAFSLDIEELEARLELAVLHVNCWADTCGANGTCYKHVCGANGE